MSLDPDIQVEVSCTCLACVAESPQQRLKRRLGQRHNREGRRREERVEAVTGARRVAGPGRMDVRTPDEAIEVKPMRAIVERDFMQAERLAGNRVAVLCYVKGQRVLEVREIA